MNLRTTLLALLGVAAASALVFGAACSDNNTDACPDKGTTDKPGIKSGDPCTARDLQCPIDVLVTGCDGTQTTVASSCTCSVTSSNSGTWVCTDPGNQCPPLATDDGGDDGSADAPDDTTPADDSSPGDDAATDAPTDSPTDAKND